jgi:hypothetical protein
MSEREPIPTISGSEGVPDQQELKWAFPDVSPGQAPYRWSSSCTTTSYQKDNCQQDHFGCRNQRD